MADMQRIKRELKYAGAVVDVYADTMKFKNGNTEVWDTVLHKKGAAAVIPVLPDGRIILVRQYRNALDKEVLEIIDIVNFVCHGNNKVIYLIHGVDGDSLVIFLDENTRTNAGLESRNIGSESASSEGRAIR